MGSWTAKRRVWLRAIGAASLLCLPLGCLSPTLPLPPPSRPDVSPPDASGLTTVAGHVPGGTTAIAQNMSSGQLVGQLTSSSGNYELVLPAASGDTLAIWYRDGLIDSGAVEVTVPSSQAELGPLGGSSGTGN